MNEKEQVELERFVFLVREYIEKDFIKDFGEKPKVWLEEQMFFSGKTLCLNLREVIWGMELDRITIRYPLNWQEAVKERFAPKWLLTRWPVKRGEKTITINGLVPGIKWPDEIEGYSTTMMVKLEQ